jgi:transcriptional regulator with XRE-family HTH domain
MAPKRDTALDSWGRELALACDAAGMARKQLAQALHVAESTVSQWINGKRTPYLKDVERCDEALGTNGYLARYFERWVTREIPSEWDSEWLAAEAQANLLQNFELSVIPGLLQTPDYARAVLQYNRHAPIDIEERVRRRIKRQDILTDDNPPMCIFVIDEYALHRMVGGKEVMLEQLTRLRDLASQPNIVIKIVPSNTEYYAGCPFMVARMDSIEIVNLDDALSGRVIKERGKVVEIVKIWEEIREAALSSKESLQLIEKVMEKWTP